MKRKIWIVILNIMIVIIVKLLYNSITNTIIITNYSEGKYLESYAKALTQFNVTQKYVANYNYGNILYQKGEYKKAIEEYKKALEGIVPKYKECDIRINYTLSMCNTVNVDEKSQDSIKQAIGVYKEAIDVITENGCANKNDNNGHSQKAEQLKKDILKEIERLEKLQKDENKNNKENDEQQTNKTKEDIQTIEEKIKQIKEDATKEQREVENEYKNYGKDYKSVEKNW